MDKKKICILGSGAAGMAAAYGLSSSEQLREEYEVTIYQVGWRAGGKCSTGRNKENNSIEQNCAHYLFGCYDNTFAMIRNAYSELAAAGMALESFDDVLLPRNLVALKQKFKGDWQTWLVEFPANSAVPGDSGGEELSADNYITMAIELVLEGIFGWKIVDKLNHFESHRIESTQTHLADHPMSIFSKMGHFVGASSMRALHFVSKARHIKRSWLDALISFALKCFRALMWSIEKSHVETNLARQRKWTMIDFGCTTMIGLLDDAVLQPGGFEGIDKYDFREWIRLNGGTEYAANSPFVELWYQNSLAYIDGDLDKPSMSAGIAMLAQMRAAFTYKGDVAYSLKDEIGDSFISPLYRALQDRGVKFNFFHRIRELVPDETGTSMSSILVERQVTLASGDPAGYQPLTDENFWPAEPDPSQFSLEDRQRYESAGDGINLESFYTTWRGTNITLTRGEDFDEVIFALPMSVIPYCCQAMYNNAEQPMWKTLHDSNPMVESQSLRLWFKPTMDQLGWPFPPPIMSGYQTPFCTWEDDSQLLANEHWPVDSAPQSIACVFGPIVAPKFAPPPDDQTYIPKQDQVVELSSKDFCTNLAGGIWPDAGDSSNPNGIDPNKLAGSAPRANSGPLERYTMTWPDCLQTRPKTDESGVEGLYLAGDWIRNGLEAGSMEGATMSGLQASRAICGFPKDIVGDQDSFY